MKMTRLITLLCLMAHTNSVSFAQEAPNEHPQKTIHNLLAANHLGLYNPNEKLPRLSTLTPNLNTHQRLSILYGCFDEQARKKDSYFNEKDAVVSPQSWYDLQLFRGEHTAEHNVFNCINRTETFAGYIKLQEMLSQPLSNVDDLQKRQNIVREIVENDQLYQSLSTKLKQLKKNENTVLSLWAMDENSQQALMGLVQREYSPERVAEIKKHYERIFSEATVKKIMEDSGITSDPSKHFVTNWKTVRYNRWLRPYVTFVKGLIKLYGFSEVLYLLKSLAKKGTPDLIARHFFEKAQPHLTMESFKAIPGKIASMSRSAATYVPRLINEKIKSIETATTQGKVQAITTILLVTYSLYKLYQVFAWIGEHNRLERLNTYLLQDKVREIGHFITTAQSLGASCSDVIDASALSLCTDDPAHPFNELNKLLASSGVQSKAWSRFYTTWIGKTMAAYDIVRKHRATHLVPMLETIGTIDAYVSIATLVREHRDAPNSYCFPTIIDPVKTEQPEINLTGVWHPLLSPEKAVGSNFALGGKRIERNGILTGPNAGGKSTNLNAIAISLVMGQSFGVAAAQKMMFTPFRVINTYMNITEDMAKGRSTFKMEAYRANQLVKAIRASQNNEYVFSIMDEIFSGTNPAEGQAAAYSIARYLAMLKNSMLMLATHYPIMKRLEADTNGVFKNFKIKAEVQPISYPFNLHEGASNQHIALEILREEGFDGDDLLKYADDIMAHPEKYGLGADGVTAA